MPAHYGKKKPAKKKRVKAGYGAKMKRVKAMSMKKKKKKTVKAAYGSTMKKRIMAKDKKKKKMNGLTPAQKKLPMALQKAILKKRKKK